MNECGECGGICEMNVVNVRMRDDPQFIVTCARTGVCLIKCVNLRILKLILHGRKEI